MAYREAEPPTIPEAPPTELAYRPMTRRRASGLVVMQVVAIPFAVGFALSFVHPSAGLAGLVASAVFLVWWWRRPTAAAATLRVRAGTLHVYFGDRSEAESIALRKLRDVVLDTKTIQPVMDGGSAIPAMRVIDPSIGPEVDTSRIVLVARKRKIRLTEDFQPNIDSSEWIAKVRVFLRKNGWVPADERE